MFHHVLFITYSLLCGTSYNNGMRNSEIWKLSFPQHTTFPHITKSIIYQKDYTKHFVLRITKPFQTYCIQTTCEGGVCTEVLQIFNTSHPSTPQKASIHFSWKIRTVENDVKPRDTFVRMKVGVTECRVIQQLFGVHFIT